MKEKTPLSCEVVCFQMLDCETSNCKSEVSKFGLGENSESEDIKESFFDRIQIINFQLVNSWPLLFCLQISSKIKGCCRRLSEGTKTQPSVV